MIYNINEARNVEEYKAEKAAREKAEQDKKERQDNRRYAKENRAFEYASKGNTLVEDDFHNRQHVGSSNTKTKEKHMLMKSPILGMYVDKATTRDPSKEDKQREKYSKQFAKRNDAKKDPEVMDAVNRNMRRHPERWDGDKPVDPKKSVKPKSESTIFDDVEII